MFLRDVPTVFAVGQQCPLIDVPAPNSKRATAFLKDQYLAYIYRLFHQSTDTPRRITMSDLIKAFPNHSEAK